MRITKRGRLISICTVLILALVFTWLPLDDTYAVMKEVEKPQTTTTFSSSDTFEDDYCKASVKGKTMTISYQTMIPSCEFRIALYGVVPKTGYTDLGIYVPAEYKGTSSTGRSIYGFEYTIDFSDLDVDDGQYFLYLSCIENPGDTYETAPNSGGLYKNLVFSLKNDSPKIFRYDDVIAENNRVQAIGEDYDPSWYLDEYLEDIRFTLKIPVTTVYEDMTASKISFMRRMSDQITAGATTDYDKLLKIYEYVTSEFYYDSVAFSTHSYQYANPYNNLYHHVYKIPSENSDNQGRVATTCQGYAAIFLSLARAQGIPTRFVYGHRATSPTNNWETEADIGVKDHWWVESYVNGRWIFIDPTIGTNNKYNKNTGIWQYFGLTNYTYFDPSDEQIAVSHIYHNIYPDKRWGYLITDEAEISAISAFLEAETDGVKNGTILNTAYDINDMTTWGDGTKSHFMGNGYGNTTQIQWSYRGFTGDVDFSGFKKLRLVSMHHNNLENVDLRNCPSLENVYLYNNNLQSVNLENDKNLQFASITTDNSLKDAWLYANNKNIYIHAEDHGSFYLKYDITKKNKVELKFRPDIGYKASGLYNGNNKKLTSSATGYSMNPGWYNYELRFVLDPDSYVYYLYEGRNTSTVKPYTKAVQERLKELGYYDGEIDGIFDEQLASVVIDFQRVNTITRTGNVGENTWEVLFSTGAKKRPSDEILQQITDFNNQSVTTDVTVTAGKVVITWELADPEGPVPTGYQIWKSTKSDSGFSKIGSTKNFKFINTANLKKGTRYYYKVRGYKSINGKIYYTAYDKFDLKAK